MSGVRSGPRTLAGRYELDGVIGRGGMGTVHRATDTVLGREVAVKLLPAALAEADPTAVIRFEREARAAAALRHPGVVLVYDAGVDGDERFIVMELVRGRSLEALLRAAGGPLSPARAAAIAAAVADALAAAHAAGIVHRDIKPANVMVDEHDAVKVLDFGIARAAGATTLTQATSVIGSAAYLAPELAAGGSADARSDIYALGCVLYALVTGAPPFRGERVEALLHQHATVAPRSPRAVNARVPAALSALTLALLEKHPADRPASMAGVRDRLSALAARPGATPATLPLLTGRLRGRRPGSRSRLAPILAVAAALLAAVAILSAEGGSGPHHRAGHVARRHGTAVTASTAAPPATTAARAATTAAPVATTPAPVTTPPGASPTPPGAQPAVALSALLHRYVQSGAISPQAGDKLFHRLAKLLGRAATGDVTPGLDDLAARIRALAQQGEPSAAATVRDGGPAGAGHGGDGGQGAGGGGGGGAGGD